MILFHEVIKISRLSDLDRRLVDPVVVANRGVVLSDGGRPLESIPLLHRALTLDPDFNEARFNLALAHLRAGQKSDAAREADELLRRLAPDAPQRRVVERLREAAGRSGK